MRLLKNIAHQLHHNHFNDQIHSQDDLAEIKREKPQFSDPVNAKLLIDIPGVTNAKPYSGISQVNLYLEYEFYATIRI